MTTRGIIVSLLATGMMIQPIFCQANDCQPGVASPGADSLDGCKSTIIRIYESAAHIRQYCDTPDSRVGVSKQNAAAGCDEGRQIDASCKSLKETYTEAKEMEECDAVLQELGGGDVCDNISFQGLADLRKACGDDYMYKVCGEPRGRPKNETR
jgi:hypothetical protein